MKKVILITIVGGLIALMVSLLIVVSMEKTASPVPVIYNHTLEPEKESVPEPALTFNETAPPSSKLNPDEDAPPMIAEVPSK